MGATQVLINRQMDYGVGYLYTTEYFSAVKKNEIQLFAATWMDLESTMFSEVSHTEKDKHFGFPWWRRC